MARRFKLKLRLCCPTSHARGIVFAVPDSKSIRKLRTLHVRKTGQGSMDATICHIPVGVAANMVPLVEDYADGAWRAVPVCDTI